MVHIAPVDALDHHFARVAEPSHHFNGLFVDSVRHEVLSQGTVVTIGNFLGRVRGRFFLRLTSSIVQVFHIDKVDVSIL